MRYLTLMLIVFFLPSTLWGQDSNNQQNQYRSQSGWSTSMRGGAVYQLDTDLDSGGSYSSGRYNIEASRNYSWDSKTSASLSLSYSYDDYNFSGDVADSLTVQSPWDNIHSFSISTPLRKGINDNWSAFIIPSLRSTGETGSQFDQTITGGAFAGAAYKFGKRLTIGPGIGIVSQLEESASIFPVLIIKWNITDKLSLDTGRGLAATLGPGLTLSYKADQKWKFAVGGRYEKLRFRLDKNGDIPGGIGEDSSFPLFGSCTYNINRKTTISLITGVEIGGELKVENSKGHTIIEESNDPGVLGGLTFIMRF